MFCAKAASGAVEIRTGSYYNLTVSERLISDYTVKEIDSYEMLGTEEVTALPVRQRESVIGWKRFCEKGRR